MDADASEVDDLRERLEVFGAFMGGIIMEFDADLRYERVWTAQPGLLALPAENLVGKNVRDVLGPREFALIEEAVARVDAEGKPTALDYVLDVADGRRAFSAELLGRTRGGRKTYCMLIRDVTEARALEGKLLQTERLAALGLLAASVMHEIRQPLSYLLTSIDVVERDLAGAELGASTGASLANIRAGGRRMAEIAGSLDFLAGRRQQNSSFDVRVPIQAALDLCASELTGIAVDRDTPELPRVRGNEGELCQVITNLLLNSAHSFEGGSPDSARTIAIRTSLLGDRVAIAVEDNGAGIPETLRTRVFDPFFTTKENGRGTGLGLFVSRSIIEAQGGAMQLVTNDAPGTTIEVLLPVAEEQAGDAPISSTKPAAARRRLSILIVDDEPRFRESLRLALSAEHDVETRSGNAALAELTAAPDRFQLVLCDMAMAHVDGVSFYAHMKGLGIEDRFILMTAGAFTDRAREFIDAQLCPIVTKPVEIDDLLALFDQRIVAIAASTQHRKQR